MFILRVFLIPLFLLLVPVLLNATESPPLEERMSQSDFKASGLDKLNPDELKALNTWLNGHGDKLPITASGTPLFYPNESTREVVESRIKGQFTGWRGKTVFKLENGQEWQQAESGSYNDARNQPRVKIKPMILGSWLMWVDGCGCSIRVKRLK